MKRSRNRPVQCYLNDQEFLEFKKKCKNLSMNQSAFLRHLICYSDQKIYPAAEMKKVQTELSKIGNNLNQISKLANQNNYVDSQMIDVAVNLVSQLRQIIFDEILRK